MMDVIYNLLIHGEYHSWAMTARDCAAIALDMGLSFTEFACVMEAAA